MYHPNANVVANAAGTGVPTRITKIAAAATEPLTAAVRGTHTQSQPLRTQLEVERDEGQQGVERPRQGGGRRKREEVTEGVPSQ